MQIPGPALAASCVLLLSGPAAADGPERWYMNEEWYDWHPRADFRPDGESAVAAEIHFVGPGAPTPRGIYVRGPADAPLEKIVARVTDEKDRPVPAEPAAVEAGGTPPGRRWVRLGRGVFVRGFKRLRLELPPGAAFDCVCVSPNDRYLTDGRAERRIRDREAGKEIRCGMPLGGIGTGKVELARDGRLRNITTNNNLETPFYHPDLCFLAASVDGVGRVLRDEAAPGLPAVGAIDFAPRLMSARLSCPDPAWPVRVGVAGWAPLVPGNVEDSSLPAAVFEFTVVNDTDKPVTAAFAVAWENLLGSGGRPQPIPEWGKTGHYLRFRDDTGNRQRPLVHERLNGLVFEGGPKQEPDGEGDYTLATPKAPGTEVSLLVDFDAAKGGEAWRRFAADGRFPDPPGDAGHGAAGLAVRVRVPPGGDVRVPIVFAWHLKHFHQLGREDLGHFYANRFPDSTAVADYVMRERLRLAEEGVGAAGIFLRSSLPDWFQQTLLDDTFPHVTDTWLTRDGRFSVSEGASNMYGTMGTLDQKLYASHALVLLYPSLQMQELRHFARLQASDGRMTHDLGTGCFPAGVGPVDWPDLNCAFVILSWQAYRYTADAAFWAEVRPKVDRAIDALGTVFDREGLGLAGGGSTFDDERGHRLSSYHAGLQLCALQIGMAIAREGGDAAREGDLRARFDRARALAMKELFSGSYFVYGVGPKEHERSESSHFAQLAGDFFSCLLGFGGVYEPAIRRTALASLFRLHAHAGFRLPPKLVQPDGSLYPREGALPNAPVSWPMHARALLCGNAFYNGRASEGWALLQRMRDAIAAANGPDPWDQSLYYDPMTARHDWGVFYMTAPASWLAYQALVDTHVDAVTRTLTLRPEAAAALGFERFPIVTPCFLGTGETSADGARLAVTVKRRSAAPLARRSPQGEGGESLAAVRLSAGVKAASARVDGKDVPARLDGDRLVFGTPVALRAGTRIELKLER